MPPYVPSRQSIPQSWAATPKEIDVSILRAAASIIEHDSLHHRVLTLTLGQGASICDMNAPLHSARHRGGRDHSAACTKKHEKGNTMSHEMLSDVATRIREQAAAYCESNKIPGYLAGVYHDGDQTVVAHGVANVVTGAPMRENTGFLFGSVTKLLTTTLVLQQVERGVIDLDERVVAYLPEFKLTTPSAAEKSRRSRIRPSPS